MKVFVINLAHRRDRWQHMSGALSEVGIGNVERIEAVNGREADLRGCIHHVRMWLYNISPRRTLGAIGCFLSHRIIWRRMVDEQIPMALVLEDDCTFGAWKPEVTALDLPAMGLDMLRLGANPTRYGNYRNQVTRTPLKAVSRSCPGFDISLDQTAGTLAYLLTLDGARKMLRCRKYWFPVDHFDVWHRFYGVRSGLCLPRVVEQFASRSDIVEKKGFRFMRRWRRRASNLLRRLLTRPLQTG
ncbi:MAG: glycosyltransferase family 25 protein [Rhizobiales bacterium]|nr:glycosyltransferase family 25 protein [Hyphomicrobiales bacterium]